MKIKEITLTDEELNKAIRDFLAWRNITVKVTAVEGHGYPRKGWDVTVDVEDTAPHPQIASVEELGKAIESGEVP